MPRRTSPDSSAQNSARASRRLTAGLVVVTALACYDATIPAVRPIILQVADTGTADGASLITIAVVIDTMIPPGKRTVTLTTSAGVFAISGTATATTEPNESGVARTLLRAPNDSTTALVGATVDGTTATKLLTFRRAMPDVVDVAPAQLTLTSGTAHELTLSATLRRVVGRPSPGLRVTFTSADTTEVHSPRGAFLPAITVSDANGIATTRFSIADTSYHGPLTLRATVAPSGIIGETVIQVVAP